MTNFSILGLIYHRYSNIMNCSVTYKLAETCDKMRFSCNSFDIHNKEENYYYLNAWYGCDNGDSMEIQNHQYHQYYGEWIKRNR